MKKILAAAITAALCLSLLSACAGGGGAQKQVDLSEFAKTLQEKYEFASYLTEMDTDKEWVEQFLPGLLEMDLEQRILLMTMISLNNGEIDLIQTKTADDASKVAELFTNRIDYMVGDGESPGGAWYPGPTELWTNCSQVVTKGNYVMLVVGDDYDQVVADFNALFE